MGTCWKPVFCSPFVLQGWPVGWGGTALGTSRSGRYGRAGSRCGGITVGVTMKAGRGQPDGCLGKSQPEGTAVPRSHWIVTKPSCEQAPQLPHGARAGCRQAGTRTPGRPGPGPPRFGPRLRLRPATILMIIISRALRLLLEGRGSSNSNFSFLPLAFLPRLHFSWVLYFNVRWSVNYIPWAVSERTGGWPRGRNRPRQRGKELVGGRPEPTQGPTEGCPGSVQPSDRKNRGLCGWTLSGQLSSLSRQADREAGGSSFETCQDESPQPQVSRRKW